MLRRQTVIEHPHLTALTAVAAIVVIMMTGFGSKALATQPAVGFIRPGAIEAGIGVSFESIAGLTRTTAALRAGHFARLARGLWEFELEPSYSRIGSLSTVQMEGAISYQFFPAPSPANGFIAIAGGVQQELLGSFAVARYPLGVNVGARWFWTRRVAFRSEYRYRRLFHDPVADYSEHRVLMGLSVLFRNDRSQPSPP